MPATGCVRPVSTDCTAQGTAETLQLKKGNAVALTLKLLRDMQPESNLATASRIVFAIKLKPTDDDAKAVILFEHLLAVPHAQIEIDTPSTGYVRVSLTSSDMDLAIRTYVYALQVEWGVDQKVEWEFGDGKIRVVQDVIR